MRRDFMAAVPWGVPDATIVFQPLSTGVSASFVQSQTENGRGEQGVIYYAASLPFGDFIDKVVLPDNSEEVIDGYLTNAHQTPFTVYKNGTYTFILHTQEPAEIPLNVEVTQFGDIEINADSTLNIHISRAGWLSTASKADILGIMYANGPATAKDLDSGNAATVNMSDADVTKIKELDTDGKQTTVTLNASYERTDGTGVTNTAC
jgi:hypothetical protein